jgi:hypothetical protein
MEDKISIVEITMNKKIEILNMVNKIEFKCFKDDIKSNMASIILKRWKEKIISKRIL